MTHRYRYFLSAVLTLGVIVHAIAQPGANDPTFNIGTGFEDQNNYSGVNDLAMQPDGRVIVGGSFTSFNGTPALHVARLNSDGTLDPSFTPPPLGTVDRLLLQPNGKVLVGGYGFLVRLLPDGGLDQSFLPGGMSLNGRVHALAQQSNGRILVGGTFTRYNGTYAPCIVRLKVNGTVDPSFDAGPLDPDSVRVHKIGTILVQPNGRIVVGGSFWQFGPNIAANILRLMPNGTMDSGFDTGWGLDSGWPDSGEVTDLLLQPDGRILVCGAFTYYNNDHWVMDGIVRDDLARLNGDGSLDTTYTTGGSGIRTMVLKESGEVIIAGNFTEVNGVPMEELARLRSNGNIDPTFDPGTGVDMGGLPQTINALALQPNGDIIIAGEFNTYDGAPRGSIARVLGSPAGCQPTQLTTTSDPVITCGATQLDFTGGSVIAADVVPGANKYQFLFTNVTGQPAYARSIAFATPAFILTQWYTMPLKAGRTYNVFVRASFDNGATWCAYGPSCTVKMSWTPLAPGLEPRNMEVEGTDGPEVLLYPNPTNGDNLRISLSGVYPELTTVSLDVTDLFGKRVMSSTLPINDGEIDAALSLIGDLSNGLYIATITAGEDTFNQCFVLDR